MARNLFSLVIAWSAIVGLLPAPGLAGGSSEQVRRITVSAAASLTNVMGEIARAYEEASDGRVLLNFSGSNTLARQIIAGAPVDLFVSANLTEMDRVEAAGLLHPDTRLDFLSNQLVVVSPDDHASPPRSTDDLLEPTVRRIAIGNPEAVPAGVYARQYLTSRGLWARIQPKVIPTSNVRAALVAVEAGHADAAFVYRTDVATAARAVVAFEIPIEQAPRIVYPTAVTRADRHQAEARRFLAFLTGPDARVIFERAGFIVLASPHAR